VQSDVTDNITQSEVKSIQATYSGHFNTVVINADSADLWDVPTGSASLCREPQFKQVSVSFCHCCWKHCTISYWVLL